MAKKQKIAFQGVLGAHSDMACRQFYPYLETIAFPHFEEVIDAVEQEKADYCLIPIENVKAGRVAEIHNLLPKTNLYIVGEHYQRIEHCLAAPKGTKVKDIKVVYSHPQALLQCKANIRKRRFAQESATNTAVAAREVAMWNDQRKAAICSSLAAELHGLEILEKHFEDEPDNTTIFVALSREPLYEFDANERIITSLLFTARNIPAALYKALGGFATNGVNMLKIESYIPAKESRMAQFFMSFEGEPSQRNVQLALEELGFFCKKVKVLGSYPSDPERFKSAS